MATSILLVDPHPVVREGVRRILESGGPLRIVGECGQLDEAIQRLADLRPDIVITEVMLNGRSGIELLNRIQRDQPQVLPIVLSHYTERSYATRSLRAGARGFITKTAPPSSILRAVRRVAGGGLVFSDASVMRLIRQHDITEGGEPVTLLTNREMEVFTLTGQGMTPHHISERLHISLKTVYKHIANIKDELGISAANGLIHFATAWLIESRASAGRTASYTRGLAASSAS